MNKLYTVNKWNKPAFIPKGNIFDGLTMPTQYINWGNKAQVQNALAKSGNAINNFAEDTLGGLGVVSNAGGSAGSFLGGIGDKLGGVMGGGKLAGTPMGGLVGGLGSAIGGIAGNAIAGGLQSDAGNAISSIGGTIGGAVGAVNPVFGAAIGVGSQLVGGLVNAAFGTKVDEAKLNAAKEGTATYNNFTSNATSFDDISGPEAQANVQDAYSGGWFSSSKARRKNEELKRQRAEARSWADRSVTNNIYNLASDQLNDALANYAAFGGELGTNGTDFTSGLLYIDEGGSHEENPLEGVPLGVDAEGTPNLVEEGETVYNDYVFSDRIKIPHFMYKELGLGGVINKKGKGMSFADASKKLAKESEMRPNDPISQAGLDASMAKLAEVQEIERMNNMKDEYKGLEAYACGGKMGRKYDGENDYPSFLVRNRQGYWGPGADNKSFWEAANETGYTGLPAKDWLGNEIGNNPYVPLYLPNGSTSESQIIRVPYEYSDKLKERESKGEFKDKKDTKQKQLPTWMRYAPAAGSGIMALTDTLGLTNKPDYSYVNKLEAAANAVGYAPNVEYNPIGNYLTYRPMDIWFEQNRMDANSRATDRAIMNSGNPSRMAGLLANGYNSQIASGNLYRQALEYNDAKKERVADFNRKTNMFNSQMGLEASMANARYQQAAKQLGLSGLAQAAALREDIDKRIGATRSANLTNFLNSLGNIGRENFVMNQVRSISPAMNGYTYDSMNGRITHTRACGGKIKKHK